LDSGKDSVSSVSDQGDIKINIDTIDNIIEDKTTFIKMDIEGYEEKAIKGAKRHILEDYPKMAICVYHKADDMWKLKNEIFSIRNDYKIYLRHYTEGIHETVMFFVPKK
jgi:hypothetical protein